jgi:CHRD domain-containing protein
MYKKIFLFTIFVFSFVLYTNLSYIADQNAYAYVDGLSFIADLDPNQIVSEFDEYSEYDTSDASGVVYLDYDPYYDDLSYEVYLEGLSYLDGDDVEIIQIHLGTVGENGPTVLSLCNEKEGKGHCREGPGLSVEGYLKEKDLKGPLKGSSLNELIKLIESGETYVYVQSRHHPEGEIRGQIYHN